ncbi:MAG: DUF3883 domain-containing protein [Bacteroidales bacterium]|nr:DUF3883 domain-containing protein [Bacteroidales bacterium]
MSEEKKAYGMNTLTEIEGARQALLKDYCDGTRPFEMSRLRQDLRLEVDIQNNYRGREVFELLQNADDANSTWAGVSVDGDDVIVCNGGEPFSVSGFMSIMMPYSSSKYGKAGEGKIGHKGLGFRSVLNWTDAVDIQSGGVQVSFSRDYAGRLWNDEVKDRIGEPLSTLLTDYANNVCKRDVPIPVLSIPSKLEKIVDGHTRITLSIKQELNSEIVGQIRGLDAHLLLFLRHLKEINLPDRKLTISREEVESGYLLVVIEDCPSNGSSKKEHWLVHAKQGSDAFGAYELAIAYPMLGTEYKGGAVYSFFPTQIMLDLPCIVNGTFELDSSRNNITTPMPQNSFMMDKIAVAMGELSEYLVSHQQYRKDVWDAFRLLDMKDTTVPALKDLYTGLKKQKQERSVFPVARREDVFKKWSEVCALSEDLASCLVDNGIEQEHSLSNHLAPRFSEFVTEETEIPVTSEMLENYAGQCADDELARLIHALFKSGYRSEEKLRILRGDKGSLLENNAHFADGARFDQLPSFVPINYVNKSLHSALLAYSDWYNYQENKNRNLRDSLKDFIDVSVADFHTVKASISRLSNLSKQQYSELIVSLFLTYKNRKKDPVEAFDPFFHLKLMAADGHYYEATTLVWEGDGHSDRWKPYFDNLWYDALQVSQKDELRDFFVGFLNVSNFIPKEYVFFGDDQDYLKQLMEQNRSLEFGRFCRDEEIKKKNLNWAFRILPEFFEDGPEPVSLFMKDVACRELLLMKQPIFYWQSKSRQMELPISYMSFQWKRNSDQYKELVLSELKDSWLIQQYGSLGVGGELECKKILLALGARNRYEDFSVKELYDQFRKIEEGSGPSGVMRKYQLIRRALDTKFKESPISVEERDKYLAGVSLFAVQNGRIVKCEYGKVDIYYWDNDCFPSNILSRLPKLYIGNRIGAESVSKVFGVKRAEEIEFIVKTSESNACKDLEEELKSYLTKRIPYLLAARCKNSIGDIDSYKHTLYDDVVFQIRTDVRIESMVLGSGEIPMFSMINGYREKAVFYLRCPARLSLSAVVQAALTQGVDFWENIAEAICIALDVRGDDSMSSFRNILKGTLEEIEILRRKEIPLDIWEQTLRSLSMSENELGFWQYVSSDLDWAKTLADPMTRADKIKDRFGYSGFSELYGNARMPELSEIRESETVYCFLKELAEKEPKLDVLHHLPWDSGDSSEGLSSYYLSILEGIRDDQHLAFSDNLYNSLINDPARQKDYLSLVDNYWNGDYMRTISEELKFTFSEDVEVLKSYQLKIGETFGFSWVEEGLSKAPMGVDFLSDYQALLQEYPFLETSYLPLATRSLLLFPNNYTEIEQRVRAFVQDEEKKDRAALENTVAVSIGSFHFFLPPESGRGNGTGAIVSERAQRRSGRRAEQMVTDYLEKELHEVKNLKAWHKDLNPTGNDAKHYDFTYEYKGKTRYLEVKSMSGSRIIMSKGEYKFAKEHPDSYDLAIVSGDQVTVWMHPFKDGLVGREISYEFYLTPIQSS